MARIARIVVPDIPHHVVQRGNRRQKVFFKKEDRLIYLNCLHRYAKPEGVSFLAYCLMDNHVHMIAVPKHKNSLARGIGEAHKQYTKLINLREKWRGYLWEGRFKSYPLSDRHLYSAMRYVELNPVRAGLVKEAEDYPWSSAVSHVYQIKNILLDEKYEHKMIDKWSSYLKQQNGNNDNNLISKHENTGRPLGNRHFIRKLEKSTGRNLIYKITGRPSKFKRNLDLLKVSLN